jgi:hypothetical protein
MTRTKKLGTATVVVAIIVAGLQFVVTGSCDDNGKPQVDVDVGPAEIRGNVDGGGQD